MTIYTALALNRWIRHFVVAGQLGISVAIKRTRTVVLAEGPFLALGPGSTRPKRRPKDTQPLQCEGRGLLFLDSGEEGLLPLFSSNPLS